MEQVKNYRAKATFFCIGDNIRKYAELFRKIAEEGHCIGNHSQNHLNGWRTPAKIYVENVLLAQKEMETLIESTESHKLFRPPYGRLKGKQARLLQKKGFRIVMWDVLSEDYNHKLRPEKCLQNVLKNAGAGSIVVFHDSLKAEINLKAILPEILEHYSEKGFEFRTISLPVKSLQRV